MPIINGYIQSWLSLCDQMDTWKEDQQHQSDTFTSLRPVLLSSVDQFIACALPSMNPIILQLDDSFQTQDEADSSSISVMMTDRNRFLCRVASVVSRLSEFLDLNVFVLL